MKPYVERLQVENFFCVKNVDIALTRLHAFIGPNDSGKSTLLRAVWRVCAQLIGGNPGPSLTAPVGKYMVQALSGTSYVRAAETAQVPWHGGDTTAMHGAQLVRLEPDTLRMPAQLIPHGAAVRFLDSRGRGLAAVLDAMLSRHPERFLELRARFLQLFSGVERIEIQNTTDHQKVIGATLEDGRQIGPAEMSEGMLYWLAFKALQYATKPAVLLVEEPENGLHPARIREVMALLREISAETQVLIATHSPLVINELQPDEVTIITRTAEDGTIATPMTKTKNFEQRRQIYALGELWLSYADGVLESELVGPDDAKDSKAAG